MSVEITNKSGQLVPTENLRELMENSLQELKLNAECELNMVFVDEAEMTELHIKWMNEGGAPMCSLSRWTCQAPQVKL